MVIDRNAYLYKLLLKMNNKRMKVITGIRNCGKSFILYPLFINYLLATGVPLNHIIGLNLAIARNKIFRDPDELDDFIRRSIKDSEKYYIIIDNIQLVKEFESILDGYLFRDNVDIYLTSSNLNILIPAITRAFPNLWDEIRVYPLSFREFMSVYEGSKIFGLKEYMTYGGLPLIMTLKNNKEKIEYLNSQMNDVNIVDVIKRYHLRQRGDLKPLLNFLSSSITQYLNSNRLLNAFSTLNRKNITYKTIARCLKRLEETYVIENVKKYDINGEKYIKTPSKYYFTDTGLRNSLLDFDKLETKDLIENIIYLELKRRGYKVATGFTDKRTILENGIRRYQQLNIDFIAVKGADTCYIQSIYSIEDKNEKENALNPLLLIRNNFKRIIIIYDYLLKMRSESGVVYMSIYEFLLNPNSLTDI